MSMPKPEFFDYTHLAQEAGVSDADLARLKQAIRADYPGDDMLYELRLLRTCRAIRDGHSTVAEALRDFGRNESSSAA